MLFLDRIWKSYSGSTVLKDISLEVEKNSITGIIGPNGAGKSTLLKIIVGFEFADRGEIFINGKRVKTYNERKDYIMYMPEVMSIYPYYTVGEFLNIYHKLMKCKDKQLEDALSIGTIYKKQIKNLSKGWHQRLKLYIALAPQKPLVILDEPFDGFDPLQMIKIIELFKKRKKSGVSFILSIHQLENAQKICDYFVLLDEGRIVASGNLKTLSKQFRIRDMSLEKIFIKALKR